MTNTKILRAGQYQLLYSEPLKIRTIFSQPTFFGKKCWNLTSIIYLLTFCLFDDIKKNIITTHANHSATSNAILTKMHVQPERLNFLYSASMKSYQYQSFDISENILCNSWATVTFVFLVNDKLIWRDKTVIRPLELWCPWCTCILCFLQFLRIWNHHF